MRLFLAFFAVALLSLASAAATVTVELRPAQFDPAEGLTPMTTADGTTFHVSAEVIVSNADIESARADVDHYSGMPVVSVRLNKEGARKFADYTTANVMGYLAIVVDGQLISAPMIREPITAGGIQISGNFTKEEAERIAAGLKP